MWNGVKTTISILLTFGYILSMTQQPLNKLIGRISKEDERYAMLQTIPQKIGNKMMICNQMCYVGNVLSKDSTFSILYYENHPYYPNGEISLQYTIHDNNYKHILGNNYPPNWVMSSYTDKQKWIEYEHD